VIRRRGEVGDLGEEVRILARQLELGVQAPDDQVIAVGLDGQLLVGAGRRIEPIRAVGRITEPGWSTFTPSTR
jgi:hypothetical protein